MKQAITRLTIELSEEQKKKLKILATLSNMTIKDFIIDSTIGLEPNEETIKSFEDVKNNAGLTKNKNFDEFWSSLNK